MAKSLALAVGGILAALLTRFVGDELKAWMPWLTKRLLLLAIERLPECQRERFSEEWASHLNEVPGELGKVLTTLGLLSAAQRITSLLTYGEPPLKRVIRRTFDIALRSAVLFGVAPLFCASHPILSIIAPAQKVRFPAGSRGRRERKIGPNSFIRRILASKFFENSPATG